MALNTRAQLWVSIATFAVAQAIPLFERGLSIININYFLPLSIDSLPRITIIAPVLLSIAILLDSKKVPNLKHTLWIIEMSIALLIVVLMVYSLLVGGSLGIYLALWPIGTINALFVLASLILLCSTVLRNGGANKMEI
ncbi:MAG TPA: hypothetical protein VJI96_00805 [Candidatus Andersenbacteria bacterium]|nr:hypothetical protein [Candidatus Andersenbacteria bacterium]